MKTFYLGAHHPNWLAKAGVPLFISHRRLQGYKTLPKAIEHWALDSGGFSEISQFGKWTTTPEQYVQAVKRYDQEIGHLGWAAPQDWMCEPDMLTKTGLTVREHQQRTVRNFLQLQQLWGDDSPFMPVLQGWTVDDYLHCMELYNIAGIDLESFPLVGVGSVCRRQATGEIGMIFQSILKHQDLLIHGFGVKLRGLQDYGHLLNSADSMAWSYWARRDPPHAGLHRTQVVFKLHQVRDVVAREGRPHPIPPPTVL
jgi:hypothetical protein